MTTDRLSHVLGGIRHVMFDFDGPICHVFAGRPAPGVATRLREFVASHGDVPDELKNETDPLGFYRCRDIFEAGLAEQLVAKLRSEEIAAAETAELTPGATESMEACAQTGRVVTVVSNNTAAAVRMFLAKHDLDRYVAFVAGRSDESPALMKPNPYLLVEASRAVHMPLGLSALIGDSTSDIEAAHAAGAAAIGYANKPGKAEAFATLGADAIITRMREVAAALSASA